MASCKKTSSRKRLRPERENRPTSARKRIHPAIRRQIKNCFCSKPGKVITEPDGGFRLFLTCANYDTAKRCMYLQEIDSSWIVEVTINVTENVSPRKVLAQRYGGEGDSRH